MSESYEKPAPRRPSDPAAAQQPAKAPKDARADDAAGRSAEGGGLSPALESEGGGANRRGQGCSDIDRP
jgi:hypothetical protein